MTINHTDGMTDVYMVTIYGHGIEDHHIYHYLKEAKHKFEMVKYDMKERFSDYQPGTIVSIYDMKKDKRLAFYKKLF